MDYAEQHSTKFKRRAPQPQYWMDFAVGRTSFTVQTAVSIQKKYLSVQLVIWPPNAKPQYHALLADKQAIEHEIGTELKWIEAPALKSSYITLYSDHRDPAEKSDWEGQHRWLLTNLEAFRRCFTPRVKALVVAPTMPTETANSVE